MHNGYQTGKNRVSDAQPHGTATTLPTDGDPPDFALGSAEICI